MQQTNFTGTVLENVSTPLVQNVSTPITPNLPIEELALANGDLLVISFALKIDCSGAPGTAIASIQLRFNGVTKNSITLPDIEDSDSQTIIGQYICTIDGDAIDVINAAMILNNNATDATRVADDTGNAGALSNAALAFTVNQTDCNAIIRALTVTRVRAGL